MLNNSNGMGGIFYQIPKNKWSLRFYQYVFALLKLICWRAEDSPPLMFHIKCIYFSWKVWVYGDLWCSVWLAVDVWMCTASILNLCAISLDRYLAVTRPVSYPQASTIQHSCKTIILVRSDRRIMRRSIRSRSLTYLYYT